MAKSSYAATHYGECQLCGHEQKLPGGGRLSLHGYTTQWGFFSGVCSGARHLPYEQSCDLLKGEIVNQREVIKSIKAFVAEITSPSFADVFVQEYVPQGFRGQGGSSYVERRLTPSQYTVKETKHGDWSSFEIVWMTKANGKFKSEQKTVSHFESRTAAALIAYANKAKIASLDMTIKQREGYVEWLKERIVKFVVRPLRPIPVEEQGSAKTILHAVNGYWSKREGRDIALCVSSIRAAGYKVTTKDATKVTCKACLKALATSAAEAVIAQKADALIAEMIVKFGEGVKEQFSKANDAAIREVRYQRKDIDKAVRQATCTRLERGMRS